MNKTKNFTTTLHTDLLQRIEEVSKELKVPKNDILTEAFLFWDKKRKQNFVKDSYAKAKLDKEWKSLSEEGLCDW